MNINYKTLIKKIAQTRNIETWNYKGNERSELSAAEFIAKLEELEPEERTVEAIKEKAVGSLNLTFNKKLCIKAVDDYYAQLKSVFQESEQVHAPSECYQIPKSRGYETPAHVDCHRRPHVTLYFVTKGSTVFI